MPGISSLKRSVSTSAIRAFLIPCNLWLEIRFAFLSHYDFKNKMTKKNNKTILFMYVVSFCLTDIFATVNRLKNFIFIWNFNKNKKQIAGQVWLATISLFY